MHASIYLLKPEVKLSVRYSVSGGILTEDKLSVFDRGVCIFGQDDVVDRLRRLKVTVKPVRRSESTNNVYFRNLKGHTPDWKEFWGIQENVQVRSASCVAFIETTNNRYAVCHGRGTGILNPFGLVSNFGLKIVLNVVDTDHLSGADIFTPSDIGLQRRIRTGRLTNFRSYDVNVFNALLRNLSGKVKQEYQHLLKGVDGSDSLRIDIGTSVDELTDILAQIDHIFQLETYKKGDLRWIDNFSIVKDKAKAANLDRRLLEALNSRDTTLMLVMPSLLNRTNVVRYRFTGLGENKQNIFDGTDIVTTVFALLNRSGLKLDTVENLKKPRLRVLEYDDDEELENFPLYQCLNFEIRDDSGWYFIESGRWYQVDKDFSNEIDAAYAAAITSEFPIPLKYNRIQLRTAHRKPKAKKDMYEAWYNTELVAHETSLGRKSQCLDAKNVQMKGHDRIEVCDVISQAPDGRKALVHVKYNNGSSMLSHLFCQGNVSCELLTFKEFRERINRKINVSELKFEVDSFDPRSYLVVFGVITKRDGQGVPRLPLFSKINLRMAIQSIQTKSFGACVSFIDEA